ncbi:MAG: primase [Pseudomonadota bacterium]|jgi:DNA primase
MSIPQAFIQELLNRVDIVDVVGRYVQLKKGGANFMGLCPFHGEKSPSFSVSPAKQFYHCFGCGVNGNAIGFLMEHAGMGFVEAVSDLAQQVGLNVPQDDASPQDRERAVQLRRQQASLSDVLEKAAQAYVQHLRASPRAIAYLKGRGLSGQIAKTFGLGFSPEGWRTLANTFPDYSDEQLVTSGLVIAHEDDAQSAVPASERRRYDRFRDRIMFPIRNVKGECIGFGGRVLDKGEPKYLNSPETPVFSKGRELYGLFEARTDIRVKGYALVTEGYMDVVALAQLGFGNAVATLGTACTPEHVHKLFRFTDAIVFSFDGDAAGRRAARKALDAALPLANDTRSVKFLFLPAEHDPDSFIRANGTEAFAQCVKDAEPLSRFLLDAASADCDLSTAEGRARMAAQARPLWNALPDGALKRQLLSELAKLADLDAQDLHDLWHPRAAPSRNGPPPRSNARLDTREPRQPAHETRPMRVSGRRKGLASRADRALGLLLVNPSAWDLLSHEDHAMLTELPEPHGPLFAWLDAQRLEYGPQAWAALREGLREHPQEAFALAQADFAGDPNRDETEPEELHDVMGRLRLDAWRKQSTALAAQAAHDPQAMARLKALNERIKNHHPSGRQV